MSSFAITIVVIWGVGGLVTWMGEDCGLAYSMYTTMAMGTGWFILKLLGCI